MAQMTIFSNFPSVPRNVDDQNRKFLLAVRDAVMSLDSSMEAQAAALTVVNQTINQMTSVTQGAGGSVSTEGLPLFIQDTEPTNMFEKYLWVQTNVGGAGSGDFAILFNDGT